ncbi:uncharacterized protein BXIN_0901 [Babesia sp. Xinjiang]|uniref:uncharacterized protein n=1 Tax=Babesia sp. Xinjiang TaxID=462227 RepID=UPI000A24BDBE|nr:uncharacterized protein BXIN_0901 [Babesia sp. Xinjiang]ORM42050.1 hypothetical protein BXIN_0901 [Babesia sp. Xinjiang]
MVRLVPEFLKKIIVHKGSNTRPNSPNVLAASDSTHTSLTEGTLDGASSVKAVVSANDHKTPDTADSIVFKGDVIEHGITSNIATIALGDWGYPVYEDRRDEGIFYGKYFAGLLRSYVVNGDPLDCIIAASRSKLIPKVEESDFAEYVRQISVFYAMMGEDTTNCENLKTTKDKDVPSDTHIPKDYYSDTYVIEKNDVFRKELDCIPDILSSMEAQLEAVNGELQEMLERRYVHVHEACTSVEELHVRFLELTKQINRMRADLEGETSEMKAVHNAPSKEISMEAELDSILQSGIARKKDLQIILGHLQMLRAIVALPEYVQGVADSRGIAVANLVGNCVIKYLHGDVWKFKMVQSIVSVVKETVTNLERVAETKFVNLALVALMEFGGSADIPASVEALRAAINQIKQPTTALMNASMIEVALQTLKTASHVSRPIFHYEECDNWYELMDSFEKHRTSLLTYIFLSQVWGCMILRQILCVKNMKRTDDQTQETDSYGLLVQRVLSAIRDCLSSTAPHGNLATVPASYQLVNKLAELPGLCEDKFNYGSFLETQVTDDIHPIKVTNSEPVDFEGVEEFLRHCALIKHIVDEVVQTIFADFAQHMILLYKWKTDFAVSDVLSFIEGSKTFMMKYRRLLNDINRKYVFCPMLLRTLEDEWVAHTQKTSPDDWFAGVKAGISNLGKLATCKFSETVEAAVQNIGLSCLEAIILGNIVGLQTSLGKETWDEYYTQQYVVEKEELSFTLPKSCVMVDERLNLYLVIAQSLPAVAEGASYDCLQAMKMFHSLMDAEVSGIEFSDLGVDVLVMRKSCLIAEALRYFSHRVNDVVVNALKSISAAFTSDEYGTTLASPELESRSNKLYDDTKKCVDDLESLKQRILHIVSKYIGNKLRRKVETWISHPSDAPYEDSEVNDIIQIIQKSLDTITEILKDVTDVQLAFEMAFQQVHQGLKRDAIDAQRKEEFRDSCAKLITQLSHNTCIKLEICCLADTLSNELFS